MVLFQIPDIRLFWSQDPRFLRQFKDGTVSQFQPYSKYPGSSKDVSFWLGDREVHDNDVYDIVRDVAGELVEEVKEVSEEGLALHAADIGQIDRFTHPKTGRSSRAYRVEYRSMERWESRHVLEKYTDPGLGPSPMRKSMLYMQL